jgi:hypothetical protein
MKHLRFVTDLFRRVISIPTKLYNKHWDNFIGISLKQATKTCTGTLGEPRKKNLLI